MTEPRVTIIDVARAAGVHPSTVISLEDDMPLSADDINKIALAVNAYKIPSNGPRRSWSSRRT